jgi:hypothetical protein
MQRREFFKLIGGAAARVAAQYAGQGAARLINSGVRNDGASNRRPDRIMVV